MQHSQRAKARPRGLVLAGWQALRPGLVCQDTCASLETCPESYPLSKLKQDIAHIQNSLIDRVCLKPGFSFGGFSCFLTFKGYKSNMEPLYSSQLLVTRDLKRAAKYEP